MRFSVLAAAAAGALLTLVGASPASVDVHPDGEFPKTLTHKLIDDANA